MCKSRKIHFSVVVALAFGHVANACGPWLPNRLLDQGGKVILDPPEFYFEAELKEIAKDFPSPCKAVYPALGMVEADHADFLESGKKLITQTKTSLCTTECDSS